MKIPPKQSILIRAIQTVMKQNSTKDFTIAELENEVDSTAAKAFGNANSVKTLVSGTLKAKKGLVQSTRKRLCHASDRRRMAYTLKLPKDVKLASKNEMHGASPRRTGKKTGRPRTKKDAPEAHDPVWKRAYVGFEQLVVHRQGQARQALHCLILCYEGRIARPTSQDVGRKMTKLYGAKPSAARKRLVELEKDYNAVHAVRGATGEQYWKLGPAPGKELRVKKITKKEQTGLVRSRLQELIGRLLPRFVFGEKNMRSHARILGIPYITVRKLTSRASGVRWGDIIQREITPEEDAALEEIETKLREQGKIK